MPALSTNTYVKPVDNNFLAERYSCCISWITMWYFLIPLECFAYQLSLYNWHFLFSHLEWCFVMHLPSLQYIFLLLSQFISSHIFHRHTTTNFLFTLLYNVFYILFILDPLSTPHYFIISFVYNFTNAKPRFVSQNYNMCFNSHFISSNILTLCCKTMSFFFRTLPITTLLFFYKRPSLKCFSKI